MIYCLYSFFCHFFLPVLSYLLVSRESSSSHFTLLFRIPKRRCLAVNELVQFGHVVMSNSLWSHGQQHARLPCPSSTPRTCSNSCPLSQWCYPIISSSVIPFSFCLQSFPASGSFLMSQFFASDGQSIGASASASASFQWIFRTDFL